MNGIEEPYESYPGCLEEFRYVKTGVEEFCGRIRSVYYKRTTEEAKIAWKAWCEDIKAKLTSCESNAIGYRAVARKGIYPYNNPIASDEILGNYRECNGRYICRYPLGFGYEMWNSS